MKNILGTLGIVVALIGITVAIFQDDLRPSPPLAAEQLKEKVLQKGAAMLGVRVEEKTERHDFVAVTYIGLGLAAIVLAVVSYIRKESHRVAGMAGALGIMATAWEYVLIGLVIAVIILILSNLNISV
jgi:hypothetical protein